MDYSLSFTFGAGKVGYCLGCTNCSSEYVIAQTEESGLKAVAIINSTSVPRGRKSFDSKVRNSLNIKPELRDSLKSFEDSGHKFLFVKSIPPCYERITVELSLDAKRDPCFTITYPTEGGPQMRRQMFESGYKTSDFKVTRSGSNDTISFLGSKTSLSTVIRSAIGPNYGEFEANNVSDIANETCEFFFPTAGKPDMSSYPGIFDAVQTERFAVEKLLKPPPSKEEIETSEKLLKKLSQIQQDTLKIVQSVLEDQDCQVLLTERSENTESLSESLTNFFLAPNWKSYTTDYPRSKFMFPVPKGALLNDFRKVEHSKTEKFKHIVHKQFRTSLETAEDKDVFVDINTKKFIAELTITESGKTTGQKLKKLAKKHGKLVDLEIIADVKKNQILRPVFNLTLSELDSSQDWVYKNECYRRMTKGELSYIELNKDWVRIGLNTSNLYPNDDWLNNWAIGFHGSCHSGVKAISGSRKLKTSGERQIHEDDEDVNTVGRKKGKLCGRGAYFAEDPQVAAAFASMKGGEVAGRYCVFEVRIKPSETRVPIRNQSYRIVNDKEFARPSGICVYVGQSKLFGFASLYKPMLRIPFLKATKDNVVPERYFLPQQSVLSDESCKIRYSEIDHPMVAIEPDNRPKVILVVGASRSGKSAVVNGILNCFFDIKQTDFFRYEVDRENKQQSAYREALTPMDKSRTLWISGYLFQNDEKIFVIDTPGFDAKSVRANFDDRLIRFLTSETAQMYGLDKVDALCLVSDSSRRSQFPFDLLKFNSLRALFEDNADNNIFSISTNAMHKSGDNDQSEVAFVDQLSVDNSVLFEDTNPVEVEERSRSQWESNTENYKRLIERVCNGSTPPATLKNLRVVKTTQRVNIELSILELQQTVFELLDQSANLDRERKKLDQMKEEINNAVGDVNYSEVVYERKKRDKAPGQHVTVCLICAWNTCHENCCIEQDADKYYCAAMDRDQPFEDRCCMYCANNCHWSQHSNTPFYYEIVETTVTRSAGHWLDQYKIKQDDVAKGEKIVAELKKSIGLLLLKMHSLIDEIKKYHHELKKYDTTRKWKSRGDFVDELIVKEKRDGGKGRKERIDQLKSIKKGVIFLKEAAGLCE